MQLVSVATIVAVSLPLVLFGDDLITLWTGQSLDISTTLMAGLACWWVVMAALSPVFVVQNAAGLVRPQLLGWAIYALVSIPTKAYAASTFGVELVPWVGVALLLFTVGPAALHGYRLVLRGLVVGGPQRLLTGQERPRDA